MTLDESPASKAKIAKSRKAIADKVDAGLSVYGVSTGFGGSADTRTDQPILLGNALLQHQQSGVLPSSTQAPEILPLLDPLNSSSMPEAWVRGAILIRMNSLIRGHSGVRYELIEKMNELLCANITPLVPLRGTISASGGMFHFSPVVKCTAQSFFYAITRPFTTVIHCRYIDWQPLNQSIRRTRGLWRAPNQVVS